MSDWGSSEFSLIREGVSSWLLVNGTADLVVVGSFIMLTVVAWIVALVGLLGSAIGYDNENCVTGGTIVLL